MGYLHRDLIDELEKWLDRKEILAIKGPRQSGKTTLLYILRDYLINTKRVNPETIVYITFEDRDILDAFEQSPKDFINSYLGKKEGQKIYFLIDEFQHLKDGGQKIKLLYDVYDNIKFIITGSSSLELTGSTAKYLVGRLFSFSLYQFSFGETLATKLKNLHNIYRENNKDLYFFLMKGKDFKFSSNIFEKDFIKNFEQYCLFGGYPEVIKAENKETVQIILKNIYDTYITKDIVDFLRIGDVSCFRNIVTLLASRIGNLLNYNDLATDGKTYFKQLKHYLSILEETYVIKLLTPFFKNIATEIKKNPKIYFLDAGLRNYIIKNFNRFDIRQDTGSLVENEALSQILRANFEPINYWRTTGKAEIDFILKIGQDLVPIEIKYSFLKTASVSRGFRNFISAYNPNRAVVLTKGFSQIQKFGKTKVLFFPVWFL